MKHRKKAGPKAKSDETAQQHARIDALDCVIGGIEVADAQNQLDRDVLEASRNAPVVVDFWAPWCGPCRTLGPVLDRVAHAFGGSIKLVKINVDENPALSQAFDVRSIPRVIAFKDGRAFAEFIGALPEAQVRNFFSSLTPSAGEEAMRAAEAAVAAAADEPSEAELRETLAIDPLDHAARMQLANALARQRRYRESMEELIEVVRLGRHSRYYEVPDSRKR